MFGGSGKMGRGGGGGSAGKRNIHAPPINRAAPTGRLSMGGGPRGRGGASSAAISSPCTSSLQVEESFSLVRENPLNFGMAIKLAPDLVEEIKRVEAQGGTARIKFDANANNPNGNIIHVGDKTFKFTWSREPGDLCDIYEERRSGEDGNGLLVESGGTWRKLNVERELDESTKNHVKRRSEEAERKHKSRKAIVLDHQNPSTKNQMKALAAAESNQWRNFKHRKEPPFKKPKSEPPSGGPPKSVYKSGMSTTFTKGKLSSGSPLSSQPDQHVAPASPIGSGNLVKGYAGISDVAPTQNINRIASSDREMHSRLPSSTIRDKSKHNRNMEAKPADLRSLLISLLQEHPSKGMSIKALEKAMGDAMPNSAKQIEPILKQIATLHAPGRYLLKPGVEMESFKKPLSQSGSSPEINLHHSPALLKFDQHPVQEPSYSARTAANNEEQGELNSSPVHTMENVNRIDIMNTPEYSDKKISDKNELQGSSSDSGSDSDSDSDSSDSGSGSDSGSHSRSKSRSPAGSRSGSSSDSESDASSSSKQAPDEDVNILSDDDKEPKQKLRDSDPVSSKSPGPYFDTDNEFVDIEDDDKQEDPVPCVVEIERDSPEGDHVAERLAANYSFPDKEGEEPVEVIKPSPADHHEHEREVCDRKYDGLDSVVSDAFRPSQSGTDERLPKEKSKRRFDDKNSDERAHNRKRLKSKNFSHPVSGTIKNIFGDSPDNSSPDRPLEDPDTGPIDLTVNRTSRDGVSDPNLQAGFSQGLPTRAATDCQQLGERSLEAPVWTEAPSGEKIPGKHDSLDLGVKYSERSLQTDESLRIKKGFNAEAQSEDGLFSERRPAKFNTKSVRDKHATMTESHYRKPEMPGKVKEAGPHSNSYRAYSPKDNNTTTTGGFPVINGRGSVLRRELSDLELGEFREPFHDETPGPKKQFERKSSFKQLEHKPMDSECWNSDFSGAKPSNKIIADGGKLSPPNSEAMVVSGVPDGPSKRKAPKHHDLTRPHHKGTGPPQPQHQSCGDPMEVGSQHNKVLEMSSKNRLAEGGSGQGASLEAQGDTSRKVGINSTEQGHDTTRGVGPHTTKESRKPKSSMVGGSNDRRKDSSLTGSNEGGRKKKESSSDENSCSYTKYEKEEPELKGPIKDASQYKEYVKEYQEKYESYCSLNKILESYRDEFSKLGNDLEAYKDRDTKRYHDILEQMRSSFRQCGERHKRLKKIFVVLYEELKHLKQMIKDYAASDRKD